jgi:2-desacetyl-2-hydroxyethyl bacteriochlorophyllide A dehydrogenase
MKTRRLKFPAVGQVEWETADIPTGLDPYTVVIRARKSLISVGTELAIFSGSHIGFSLENPPFPMMPNNPGYALVGDVIAVGDVVSQVVDGLEVGQRVLAQTHHADTVAVDVRETSVFPLPGGLSDAQGMLLRMAYIALTAVRAAPLQLGETAVVYGQGPVGQLAAQLFLANGAGAVIGVDRLTDRLAISTRNGIHPLDASKVDATEAILALTDGQGADVVVEATGNPAVVSLCLEAARPGGRVVLLGSPRGMADLDIYSQIHRRGVRLIGAHETFQENAPAVAARWTKPANLAMLAALFLDGRLRSDGLIDHTIAPDEALVIYEKLLQNPQRYLGVVIEWS